MTPPQAPLKGDALLAARALYAVLNHPDAMKPGVLDERLLEALLLRGLRQIPSLGQCVFAATAGTEFSYGLQGYSDLVGHAATASVDDDPSHLIEVKVWSNYNRSKADDEPMQLDVYARNAPRAKKIVAMPEDRRGGRVRRARKEMAEYPIHTADDWDVVAWEQVRDHVGALLTPAQKKPAPDTDMVIALGRMLP
ncbi:hypothetical protein [Nocardioides pakistanensis]